MKIPRVIRHFFKGKFLLPDIHRDTPRTFAAKKMRAVAKVTPLSVIHPATANILLILGTTERGQNEECFLDQWLIWSGVSALSLYVLSVMANYILWWIINSDPNKIDRIILLLQEALSLLCAAIEVVALFSCSCILYPKLITKDYKHCPLSTVHFCAVFFTMMWILILLFCLSLTSISTVRCLRIAVPDRIKDLQQADVEKQKLTWGQIEEQFYSSKSSDKIGVKDMLLKLTGRESFPSTNTKIKSSQQQHSLDSSASSNKRRRRRTRSSKSSPSKSSSKKRTRTSTGKDSSNSATTGRFSEGSENDDDESSH